LGELARLPTPGKVVTSSRLGWHTPRLASAGAVVWAQVDLGATCTFDTIILVAASGEANGHVGAGYGFPLRFRIEISDQPTFAQRETVADFTSSDVPNPGSYPFVVPARGRRARFVRMTATQAWPRREDWIVALGEIMVLSGARNVAAGQPATASVSASALPSWDVANLTDEQSVLGPPVASGTSPTNGYLAMHEDSSQKTKWVQLDLGHERELDEIRLFPTRPTDFADTPGSGFPARFRIEVFNEPTLQDAQTIFETGEKPFINPGENSITFRADGRRGRYVRVTATQLHDRGSKCSFALAELEVWAEGRNVARGAAVSALDRYEDPMFPRWQPAYLVDGYNSRHPLIDLRSWIVGLAKRQEIERKLSRIEALRSATADGSLATVAKAGGGLLGALAFGLTLFFWSSRAARQRAVEDLRRRIARDLHDEIGSYLGSIGLLSDAAGRQSDDGPAREEFAEITRIARRTNESLREIVWLLDSRPITVGEVVTRMRETASTLTFGMQCTFEATLPCGDRTCSLEFARNFWLIFKEALHNTAKHSGARHVHVEIGATGKHLTLRIADDGRGFHESEIEPGRGLQNLRLRADQLAGTLVIDGSSRKGTVVLLKVPIP
jgi:signal transduction histidine kinase